MYDFDVYSYGMISSSMLYILNGKFPEPDFYAEIKEKYTMIGGEAANSSAVLGKLGVKVKLDGNWQSNSDSGINNVKILNSYNVDTQRLTLKDNYQAAEENVFTDGVTRTSFGTYQKLFSAGRQWNEPAEDDIKKAKLVNLDPFFGETSLKVSELCVKYGKPYVTVDCKFNDEIAQNAAVNIVSGNFLDGEYSGRNKKELFLDYTRCAKGLVIFTFGEKDIFYGRNGEGIKKYSPYKIKPKDTTGAGDSFRAGIVFGMLHVWPEEKILGFACALAAYVCESFPGIINCPDYKQIISYIKKSGRKF